MLSEEIVAAYLERIGVEGPVDTDLATLRRLHERHVLSVPFESIDYHTGVDIQMDERAVDKIVRLRKGGGCGEINTGFLFLLRALGFDTTLHQGQVWIIDRFTPPFNHLLMTVNIGGRRYIADIGFGKGSRFPLLVSADGAQSDPHGEFRTVRVDHRSTDVYCGGRLLYRFFDEPVQLADFAQNLWWYRSSPDSPLLQSLFCSLPLEDGWVVLKDDVLTVTRGGEKTTTKLEDDAAVLTAYQEWFGIPLDKRPPLSPHHTGRLKMSFDQG
ncbi:arylamine N-acetyltransferase family protein [Nocardia takedensis]|uniref:arylamine N-acetyltransferase family protein n=1 Tax=Nocardia takedensis TaxID=259390 RepID=UPI00031BD857|nr:arylamine N-acetyltransferase [Nocardia takedensis]